MLQVLFSFGIFGKSYSDRQQENAKRLQQGADIFFKSSAQVYVGQVIIYQFGCECTSQENNNLFHDANFLFIRQIGITYEVVQ